MDDRTAEAIHEKLTKAMAKAMHEIGPLEYPDDACFCSDCAKVRIYRHQQMGSLLTAIEAAGYAIVDTRIRDAQLAVLAAAWKYRASFEPQSPDSPCDTGQELDDAIFAMVEVEGGDQPA